MAVPPAVLFDLDGTLLDSVPQLLDVANTLRAQAQLPPLTDVDFRPVVPQGTAAMVAVALPNMSATARVSMMQEFTTRYAQTIQTGNRLFAGVTTLLTWLAQRQCPWGIVTNKAERLAKLIVRQLGLDLTCQVLIGGDTVIHRKPHPEPLQRAAAQLSLPAACCVYVGDTASDIQSARAAQMPAVAVTWGYHATEDDPRTWGADCLAHSPQGLCHSEAWPSRHT